MADPRACRVCRHVNPGYALSGTLRDKGSSSEIAQIYGRGMT